MATLPKTESGAQTVADLRDRTINSLVEEYPEMMPILSAHGIDLCCGGSLPLAEAAGRHSFDIELLAPVLERAKGKR